MDFHVKSPSASQDPSRPLSLLHTSILTAPASQPQLSSQETLRDTPVGSWGGAWCGSHLSLPARVSVPSEPSSLHPQPQGVSMLNQVGAASPPNFWLPLQMKILGGLSLLSSPGAHGDFGVSILGEVQTPPCRPALTGPAPSRELGWRPPCIPSKSQNPWMIWFGRDRTDH